MRKVVPLAVLLSLSESACAQAGPDRLDWIVGQWCTAPGAEQTCEQWAAEGNRWRGASRTVKGGKPAESEVMRIAVYGGKLTFFASPDGAPEVPFVAASQSAQEVTFENADHDYPQRIRYWREGRELHASISQLDGSQAVSWIYQPKGS